MWIVHVLNVNAHLVPLLRKRLTKVVTRKIEIFCQTNIAVPTRSPQQLVKAHNYILKSELTLSGGTYFHMSFAVCDAQFMHDFHGAKTYGMLACSL